jgi:3-hydroxybutyryl-CoA dehydrogenase
LPIITSPQTIGICGIGQIGLALGLACWRSGYRVWIYGRDAQKLEKARADLARIDQWMTAEFPQESPKYGEIDYTSELGPLDREADLMVEGIVEDMAAKVELWKSLAGAATRGAIFCSSTSGLSISEMGKLSGFPAQVVGTHFWNPPHLMPLVEVIGGAGTAEETIQATIQFCRSIGKQPVRVNIDAPGFIGNRMLHALWREAIDIVDRGIASAEDVDTVAKMTFGLRMPVVGPLENMDLVGLDLIHKIHRYLLADLAANPAPGRLLSDLVEKGQLGMKTGAGFYDWQQRQPAELIEARDRQIARELKRLRATKNET